jgi:hypothetical protein
MTGLLSPKDIKPSEILTMTIMGIPHWEIVDRLTPQKNKRDKK